MTILTHYAITFLLIKIVEVIFNIQFNYAEIATILVIGNLLDFDYIIARIVGIKGAGHHGLPSHTLFGVLLIWLISFVPLALIFNPAVPLVILASLVIHLLIDDSARILYYAGLRLKPKSFEINWLYPFKKSSHEIEKTKSSREYISHMGNLFYIEVISIMTATILFGTTIYPNLTKFVSN